MYKDRIKAESLLDKVMTAGQAAELINPDPVVGFSGFAAVGYPKAVPKAIVALGKASNLTVIAGASAGDEVDGALITSAEQVILELNLRHPAELCGIHDICSVGRLPQQEIIPITHPGQRIGSVSIKCDPSKIAGIVVNEGEDQEPRFVPPSEVSEKIAGHIIDFLKTEIKEGRLSRDFTFQSGFGAVANAVLYGLNSEEFGELTMYSEVVQDGALQLILDGKIKSASATSLALSDKGRKLFYDNLDTLKNKIVLRPQDLSNNGGIIRRLGEVTMNTAIEIDIYGNVNSTHIMGSSMMNGIGGSGDYARNGMISIFMTPAVAKGGAISSIVPMVSHVDHTEHDVQIIVTEYGYADLRGKAPRERAELIIENCCHPDYRQQLRDYYEGAKKVSSSRHTPHDLREALSWHQRYLDTGSMKR